MEIKQEGNAYVINNLRTDSFDEMMELFKRFYAPGPVIVVRKAHKKGTRRTCGHCKKGFLGAKDSKYCSQSCSAKALKPWLKRKY